MSKKAIICSLCLSLAFSLVGCGVQAPEPQELQKPQDIQHTEEVTPPATPTKTETKPTEEKQGDKTVAPPIEESQVIEGEAGTDESPESDTTEVELFTEVNETVYVIDTDTVNLRSGPSTDYDKVGSLSWGKEVKRIGTGKEDSEASGWSRIQLEDGSEVYVSSKYLSTTKPVASKPSSGSGGSTTSKPQASTPKQDTPAPSGGSSGGQGGLSAEDQAALEAALAMTGGQKIGHQWTQEEIDDITTDGSNSIYH